MSTTTRQEDTMDDDQTTTEVKPRCYYEFCCNRATFEVELLDRSGTGREPIPWGWCGQHKHMAWSQRSAKA